MSMDIALVRVDNRLVHGQILEAWVPFIKASRIVVVDDDVAGDFFRETVIRMAVPREIEVIVSGVEDFARNYTFSTGQGKKTIILFCSVADAAKVFHLGFRFQKLNLGNIHNEDCSKRCSSCVSLSDDDVRNILSLLNDAGVSIELRRVPMETSTDIRDMINLQL